MTILHAELILTPTDHYVVRHKHRPSHYQLLGDSGFIFALGTAQSQELRAVIDAHDTLCRTIAKAYAEKSPEQDGLESLMFSALQHDFINGIHLAIRSPTALEPLLFQKVLLVVPTASGVESWELGTLQEVLQPRNISTSVTEVSYGDTPKDPLPWED
jgi:hypothetical protein